VTAIERLFAYEALDSRGNPTVACVVTLADGAEGQTIVPAGASTGGHEAHERRDGGARYGGKGVREAVASVNSEIAAAVYGLDAADQEAVDAALRDLDDTPSLSRLGANAVLSVSLGCAIATARSIGLPLWRSLSADPKGPPLIPLPMVNIISGGAHAAAAIDIQDVLVVPLGATSFAEAIEWASRVRKGTARELRARGHDVSLVADEGGLAARLSSNREAIEVVVRGIERAELEPGEEAAIAVDLAATGLVEGDGYRLAAEGRRITTGDLVAELRAWTSEFPLVSLEDPLGEDDPLWPGLTHLLGDRLQLVGDDRFVTSADRLREGIAGGVANAVLVKPNQCGTLSEARAVVALAHEAGYATVVSARSGETEDSWLADLAIGWRAGQIKVGSTQRSERTAKWNRLLRIEAQEPDAVFAGRSALAAHGSGWPR
jgi:enolase